MCQSDYKFADLKSCCSDSLSRLEKDIEAENGKKVVLIAYERK